ncbi:MAG: oligosaccharide flippase family protein [Chloroflexota bacterium]
MNRPNAVTREASITARNVSWVLLLRLAQYPFLVLFVVLVPRLMGPEVYGQYALLSSFIALGGTVITFAADETFGRFVPEWQASQRLEMLGKFLFNFLGFKLVANLLVAAVMYLTLTVAFGHLFEPAYFLLVVAILVVSDLAALPRSLLFGLNELGKHSLREPLRRALTLALLLLFFHFYGLLGALVAVLLAEFTIGLLYVAWTHRYLRLARPELDLAFLLPYLKFGVALYLSLALFALWQRAGNPLIQYFTGSPTEVAVFDIPSQMFLVTTMLTMLVINSLMPIFTVLLAGGKADKVIAWSALIFKYLSILAVLGAATFALVGDDLVPLLLGPGFEGVYRNGSVLLLGTFPMIVAQLGYLFTILGRTPRRYLGALALALLAFLVFAAVLIPPLGALGCSIALVLSCLLLALVVFAVLLPRELRAQLTGGVRAVLLGLVFVPALAARFGLLAELALLLGLSLLYLVLLFATGTMRLAELRDLARAVRQGQGQEG